MAQHECWLLAGGGNSLMKERPQDLWGLTPNARGFRLAFVLLCGDAIFRYLSGWLRAGWRREANVGCHWFVPLSLVSTWWVPVI